MRLIGTMTTLPNRFDKISKVIMYILRQTVPLDILYINIPQKTRKGEKYIIPYNFLDKFDGFYTKVKINRCGLDLGPLTKLVPVLFLENNPKTLIFTFDDDIVVSKNVVKILKKKIKKYSNSCVGLSGLCVGSFPFYFQYAIDNTEDKKVDWIQGVHVVCYRRKFLNPNKLITFGDDSPIKNELISNDDHRISAYLASKGIQRISVGENICNHIYEMDQAAGGLSSNKLNLIKNHIKIAKYYVKKGYYKESYSIFRSIIFFFSLSVLLGILFAISLPKFFKIFGLVFGIVLGLIIIGHIFGVNKYNIKRLIR